jgi:hypothetical protein
MSSSVYCVVFCLSGVGEAGACDVESMRILPLLFWLHGHLSKWASQGFTQKIIVSRYGMIHQQDDRL